MPTRAAVFTYGDLILEGNTATATYFLDEQPFEERVTFEGLDLTRPGVRSVLTLWFLLAGLSYYKAGAAHRIDLGQTPVGPQGLALFRAAVLDGLGEFAVRNELSLDDVDISGGTPLVPVAVTVDPTQLLTPFGGGIDSIVTVEHLRHISQSLFIMSPSSGRFAPLEAAATVTGLPIIRAERHLDPLLLAKDPSHFQGHVPVTSMVMMLACAAAVATGRGGVVLSNEHSASVPNMVLNGRAVNHQWSKSADAERLIASALAESIGNQLQCASFLRDRSEVWVAQEFASLTAYHESFRSCNRAFRQEAATRATQWCNNCDKCLFINLMLAPFIPRDTLRDVMGGSALTDPAQATSLATLVGLGDTHKPFECVGDPDECAVALSEIVKNGTYDDCTWFGEISRRAGADRTLSELLEPQGSNRVPTHWHR